MEGWVLLILQVATRVRDSWGEVESKDLRGVSWAAAQPPEQFTDDHEGTKWRMEESAVVPLEALQQDQVY